jgi:hypothetical protein
MIFVVPGFLYLLFSSDFHCLIYKFKSQSLLRIGGRYEYLHTTSVLVNFQLCKIWKLYLTTMPWGVESHHMFNHAEPETKVLISCNLQVFYLVQPSLEKWDSEEMVMDSIIQLFSTRSKRAYEFRAAWKQIKPGQGTLSIIFLFHLIPNEVLETTCSISWDTQKQGLLRHFLLFHSQITCPQ